MTDPRCKRVGTQCWVYGLCMCIESLICIKFGADIFQHTQIRNIIVWILIQAAGSVMCVYLCVTHHRWQRKRQIRVVSIYYLYIYFYKLGWKVHIMHMGFFSSSLLVFLFISSIAPSPPPFPLLIPTPTPTVILLV